MKHDIEEQLRAAFAHRAESTVTTRRTGGFDQVEHVSDMPTRSTSAASLAIAAAAVLVVGGIVAFNAARTEPVGPVVQAPNASQPIETATTEPTPTGVLAGLSLDEWISLPRVDVPNQSWTIVDTGALPSSVELIDETGSVFLAPAIGVDESESAAFGAVTYQYVAHIRNDDGTELSVVLTTTAFGPCSALDDAPDPTQQATLALGGGVNATVQGSLVCWPITPEITASVEVVGSASAAGAAASIVLAQQLEFIDVARLPRETDESGRPPAPDTADLGGTLNGVSWLATVDPSSLRTMNTYADGQYLGGFENDRLSQPNDFPATTGELTLTGVPGRGALVYGYLAPEAVEVRVTNDSGGVIVLPMLQRERESYFAVPIPEGVIVDTLEFIRADGSAYANTQIGPLPYDLDGGYGGFAPIKRSPSDSHPDELDGFCGQYLSFPVEVPESYVGSPQHLADIESLRDVAPEPILGDLTTFRDYLASGAIDSINDPESNLVDNWPADVVAAAEAIVAFGQASCG